MRLTEKRRLPQDTKGDRILTPYGEIHVEAETLSLIKNWDSWDGMSGDAVGAIIGALMYDFSAGLISQGLNEEIMKRVGRVQRGKPARLERNR